MQKIKVTNYGYVHYVAQCTSCEWDCGINTNEAETSDDVIKNVRRHVRETGHRVTVEAGRSTDYSLIE